MIANSPSMYAYLHAKFVLKESKKIRVLSLGTGDPPLDTKAKDQPETEQDTKLNTVDSLANLDLMMNFETLTADAILRFVLKERYVRANKNMAENY